MSEYPSGGYWAWSFYDPDDLGSAEAMVSRNPPVVEPAWPSNRRNIVHVSDSHQVTRWEIVDDTHLQADDGTRPDPNCLLFNGRFDLDGMSAALSPDTLALLPDAQQHAWVSTDPLNPIIYRWICARRLQQIEDT